MGLEKSLKSERHHWWPQTISKYWTNENGFINRLNTNGENAEVKPKSLALIRNGHTIKLSNNPEKRTSFDQNFEGIFDRADGHSKEIIEFLLEKYTEHFNNASPELPKYHLCTLDKYELIIEIIISLAIRSPLYRDRCVAPAEWLRGELPALERDRLIAINMRDALKNITKHIKNNAVIFLFLSKEKEFIYGDGFYNDIPAITIPSKSPTVVCPLTPKICIAIEAKKSKKDNKLISTSLSNEQVELCNNTIQIYSKNELFYRNEKPVINEYFSDGQRKEYFFYDDPISNLINAIKFT